MALKVTQMSIIDQELAKIADVVTALRSIEAQENIQAIADSCIAAIRNGKKIMFAGNGGSAADAQHWSAELIARFNYDRPSIASIALTVDTSALTAIGNDYGYDYVFARQIEGLGHDGDVFVGISTSGNSPNIIRAMDAAKSKGITTIGFTGQSGGKLKDTCDLCFCAPSNETPHIQEAHAIIGHMLCALIELAIYPK